MKINVAPCGACGLWIFFINRVFCFLKINGSIIEKEERLLETPLQREETKATRKGQNGHFLDFSGPKLAQASMWLAWAMKFLHP
ncbi:hypothetical protein HKD37_19G053030 [Glycine soja]